MMTPVKYNFGQYQLDTVQKILLRDGEVVPLTRKRYHILLMLIERAGQVVRKEEIMDQVWPGRAVEEGNLTQHLFYLRRILGEDSHSPNYIITVPGVGYLFYQAVTATDEVGRTRTIGGLQSNGENLPLPSELPKETEGAEMPLTVPGGSKALRLQLILTCLVVIALAAAFLIWRRAVRERPAPAPPPVQPLVTIPGMKGDLRFSHDGRHLAFTSEGATAGSLNVFVKSVDGPEMIQLTNTSFIDHSLTWSPDNSRIAFMREAPQADRKNQIVIIPATGGDEEVIGGAWHGLDWSPDGQWLAVCETEGPGTPTGIYLFSLSTRRLVPVSQPNPKENIFDSDPKFSPNGRFVAFSRWTSSTTGDLYVADLKTGKLNQLTSDRSRLSSIQWTADGSELLFVSNRTGNYRIWRTAIGAGSIAPVEGPLGEINKITVTGSAASSRLLAYTQRFDDIDILVDDLSESNASPVPSSACSINSTRADHSPQFSPDGKQIVFISTRSGYEEVWLANTDCSGAVQLTNFNEVGVGSPRWSPDGRKIAFDRHVEGQPDIFTIDIETRKVSRLSNSPALEFLPAWSHDGQHIFFCSEGPTVKNIWRTPAAGGGDPTQITRYGGREAWALPNGRELYYTTYNKLWLKDLISGTETRVEELSGVHFDRYWTLQGGGIYYLTPEARSRCRIHRFDIQTRQTKMVREFQYSPARFVPGFSISSDETRIVISLNTYNPTDISLIRGWN